MAMPQFDLEFTRDGDIFQAMALLTLLAGLGPVTDLLVLSHGWNNDKADASALYDELLGNIDKLLNARNEPEASVPAPLRGFVDRLRNRNLAAVRVFWPSKKFTDDDLIPGGGAASAAAEAENASAVNCILDRLGDDPRVLGGADRNPGHVAAMESAKALLPQLATTDAKKKFVQLLRDILDPSVKEKDDASAGFFDVDAETLFENAQTAVVAPGGGGAGGGFQPGGRRGDGPRRFAERRSGGRASHCQFCDVLPDEVARGHGGQQGCC